MPASEMVIEATATATNSIMVVPSSAGANTPVPLSPLVIPADQAYYWTQIWQAGEAESRADLVVGQAELFVDAKSAIRWLFSAEA